MIGNKNRVHSVRVLTPQGKEFEIIKNNDTEPLTIVGSTTKSGVSTTIGSVSNDRLTRNNKNVKNSFTVDTEETERINNSAIEHFRRTKLKIKEADLYKQTAPQLSVDTEHKSTSIRSISNLLDYVNNYYPDILSKDVLKHYGYKSRPKGKLGESALYSKEVDEFDEQDYNYPKLETKNTDTCILK
ncbi:MAG: hypothetical protein PUE75_08080 [Eubacteriales bacterium]|nr:hypothetical protein [Eubacteriales bacterium]